VKTILVPAGGGESDEGVFETALAAAKPLAAHLDFFHVKVGAGEAVANTPHADFAMGPGLWSTLDQVWTAAVARAVAARHHVEDFCRRHGIAMLDRPGAREAISASWSEAAGESMPLLIRRARHSDLVVVGRPTRRGQLPGDLLERLLLQSGRPILVAPSNPAPMLTGTSMVCWKECVEAAHAVTAAMPLLRQMKRVLIVSVAEKDDAGPGSAADELARHMAWHGIRAEPLCIAAHGRSAAGALSSAARDCAADLVVMGGYGHNRIREIIFGGCTDAFLRAGERAVLLVH
jgi:nucleotide-binding universal stress UspA family protein